MFCFHRARSGARAVRRVKLSERVEDVSLGDAQLVRGVAQRDAPRVVYRPRA